MVGKFLRTLQDSLRQLGWRISPVGFRDRNGTYNIRYREVALGGSTYFLPEFAMHRPAVKRMRRGQVYEPRTHALIHTIFATCDGSMVHAGAFFGDMLPSFSRTVGGTVWSFEPVTASYILANKCLAANDCANVTLINAALSDKTGMTRVNTGTDGAGGRQEHRGGKSFVGRTGIPVPTLTIDQFEYDALQVIHLDIEGHELPALAGARATIRKHAPLVLIEDNNSECAGLLSELGYQLHGVTPELWLWVSDMRPDHKRILDEWLTTKNTRAAFPRQ